MKSRRKAREAALQALYQCDTQDNWADELIARYFEIFQSEAAASTEAVELENLAFARQLVEGVIENFDFIDAQIAQASLRWSVDRMLRVDRNIIRIAVFEVVFLEQIPTNVTLNEAIEIAKRYGADESAKFVNGVLDNVARTFAASPETVREAAMPQKRAVG